MVFHSGRSKVYLYLYMYTKLFTKCIYSYNKYTKQISSITLRMDKANRDKTACWRKILYTFSLVHISAIYIAIYVVIAFNREHCAKLLVLLVLYNFAVDACRVVVGLIMLFLLSCCSRTWVRWLVWNGAFVWEAEDEMRCTSANWLSCFLAAKTLLLMINLFWNFN